MNWLESSRSSEENRRAFTELGAGDKHVADRLQNVFDYQETQLTFSLVSFCLSNIPLAICSVVLASCSAARSIDLPARKGDKTPSIARIYNNWFGFNQLVWKGEELYQQD